MTQVTGTAPSWPAHVSVLVTGATGMQGGAVARALKRSGADVTALVRSANSEAARSLEGEGIPLALGDMEEPATLKAACVGRTTVFSVQPAPLSDKESERRQGTNLLRAASETSVSHFVHSSVSGTGWRALRPDVDPGRTRDYWDSKEDVESAVRQAGFPAYTILKPAFFMENLVPPKVATMFPLLADGELLVACPPETLLALVSADDLGAAATAVVTDPKRFAGAEIELASDVLTFPHMAAVLTEVTGRQVAAVSRSAAEIDARLGKRSWSATQIWLGVVGYPARPEHAAAHGLGPPTAFRSWAEQHRARLSVRAGRTPRAETGLCRP